MPDSRAHTRAFLFTDLRGYSAYVERHGDQSGEVLIGEYRGLVREAIASFHGAEIRTEGDSFYVVFDSVSEAVEAALVIRDAALRHAAGDGRRIPVGIGLHAGEARDGEHGIVSSAVNIAARVCAVAPAGDVLVTETVRSLVRTMLPLEFRSAGRRRLKGIREPIQLYRIDVRTEPTSARRSITRQVVGLGVFAALAIIVAVVAIAAPRQRLALTPSASPEATPASAAAEVAPTRDLSRFQELGEFPNAMEAALQDRLPSSVASRCERADREEAPEFYFGATREGYSGWVPIENRAGLNCLTDATRVFYWQASGSRFGVGNADELFFNVVTRLSIEPGSCETGSRKHEQWTAGAHSGLLMCYVSVEEHAVLQWTFTGENIYVIATRRDGDTKALYQWWRDVGRLLSR